MAGRAKAPADRDAQHVPAMKSEIQKKMKMMGDKQVVEWSQQAWKHPSFVRNPSVQEHFKAVYRKRMKGQEFTPIK